MQTGNRASIRYANALLSLAKEAKITTKVSEDAVYIIKTLQGSKDLKNLLQSPLINTEDKKQILENVFTDVQNVTSSLFGVLASNLRFNLLENIMQQYLDLLDSENGFVQAEVVSAIPLTDALRTKILMKVKTLSGKEGKLKESIDPKIIGGFVLRVGDSEYNASVLNQFEKLRTELVN
ncbi:MAG: ATP synthase F1 subunit delta [Flavobacteriaceae bacterium]|nr:ATP synthase F1 subunit delta [Flavobacteriaceae bacterium]